MSLTIEIPADLEESLRSEAARAGLDTQQFAVAALKAGLAEAASRGGLTRREVSQAVSPTQPLDLGRCLVPDLANVAEVLAAAEGERYR
jgi:hypothetical protein